MHPFALYLAATERRTELRAPPPSGAADRKTRPSTRSRSTSRRGVPGSGRFTAGLRRRVALVASAH